MTYCYEDDCFDHDDYPYDYDGWLDWNADYGDPGDYDLSIYEEEYYDD